jgi:hypothetical protein
VQENPIPWEAEKKLPNPRRKSEPPHIFRVVESRTGQFQVLCGRLPIAQGSTRLLGQFLQSELTEL